MYWFFISILSATGIFVMFKIIDKTNTPLINAITINYLIASIAGFFIAGKMPVIEILSSDWAFTGIVIGVLFIIMFFIVGYSSSKAGLSITTVASKMSVVVPMLFAIIAYKEELNTYKILSLIFAVLAISMSVYKKRSFKTNISAFVYIIPFILFLGMGLADSLVLYSKETYINNSLISVFTATLFAFSFFTGFVYLIFNPSGFKSFLTLKPWVNGSILGLCNFGSIYFVLKALNTGIFSNSAAYGIINIGVVTLSVFIGVIFFKEKLTKLNYVGIFLSILTILFLTLAGK